MSASGRKPVVSVRAEAGRWILRVFDVPTDSEVVYRTDLGSATVEPDGERLRAAVRSCLVRQGFQGIDEWCRLGRTSWYALAL